MKKLFLLSLIVILLVFGWSFYHSSNKPAKIEPVATNAEENLPKSLTVSLPKSVSNNSNEPVKFHEQFDKIENAWLLQVDSIIGTQNYTKYLKLKNHHDDEQLKAYNDFHEFIRKKHGDKFAYNMSDDHSVKEKLINGRYLNDLLKLIGPEVYKQYLNAKDQFNEDLRRNNKESIQMEF